MSDAIQPRLKKCWNCKKPLVDGNNVTCQYCNTPFANKPRIESILHQLQAEYLKDRSKKTLGRMLVIIQDLIYNLICGKLRKGGKYLSEDSIQDMVSEVIEKIIDYYENKPDFKFSISFIEYLNHMVLYPLYNYKKKNKEKNEISLYTPIKGKKGETTEKTLMDKFKLTSYLDGEGEVERYMFQESYKENLVSKVLDLISDNLLKAYSVKGFSHSFNLAILYNHYLNNKNNRFFEEWWESERELGRNLMKNFEESILHIRNGIRLEC